VTDDKRTDRQTGRQTNRKTFSYRRILPKN